MGHAGGLQDVQPRAIAVIDLEAKGPGGADHLGVDVDGGNRVAARQDGLAHDLAEAAKADDKDIARQPVRPIHAVFGHRLGADEAVMQQHEQRRQNHRDDDDRRQNRIGGAVDQPDRQGGGIKHKGEFPSLCHQHGPLQRLARRGAEDPGDGIGATGLQHHEGHHAGCHQPPVVRDDRQIQRHAHRKEEQPQKDAPERFDIDFKLMAEGRFRQQHARQKGPHRRRQAAKLHGKGCPQHHQQGGCRHHLARMGAGQDAEQRIQQIAPGQHQRHDAAQANGNPGQAGGQRHLLAARGQKGGQSQQRHDGKILQQQDRHDAPAPWGRHLAAFFQKLHDDGGRGQHKARPGDDRLRPGKAKRHAHPGQKRHAGQNLRQPQPEDVAPHGPKPRGLHFQADEEQEHHHAQFRHMQDRRRITEQAKAKGADCQASGQIPQDRPQTQALEQRHGNNGRTQQDHHGDKIKACGFCGQTPIPHFRHRKAEIPQRGKTIWHRDVRPGRLQIPLL